MFETANHLEISKFNAIKNICDEYWCFRPEKWIDLTPRQQHKLQLCIDAIRSISINSYPDDTKPGLVKMMEDKVNEVWKDWRDFVRLQKALKP